MRWSYLILMASFLGFAEPLFGKLESQWVELPQKELSIQIPDGWSVLKDIPKTTLFLEPAELSPQEYKRNIQVFTFRGSKYIDQQSSHGIAEDLINKFSAKDSIVSDFQLREHELIQLNNGNQALLFYADFTLADTPMMQAHLVFSGESFNYLISFTDVASHFGQDDASRNIIDQVWNTFLSATTATKAPNRFSMADLILLCSSCAFLVLLISGVRRWRMRWHEKRYQAFEADMEDAESVSAIPSDYGTMRSAITAISLDNFRRKQFSLGPDDIAFDESESTDKDDDIRLAG